MDAMLAAFQTGMVWAIAGGGILVAFLIARLVAAPIYENSRKSGKVGVFLPLLLVLAPGIVLTFLLFLQSPSDWVTLGVLLAITLIGAVMVFTQARKKTYHRARNACAVAIWLGIFLGTIAALLTGHILDFDQVMLLMVGLITCIVPILIYAVVGREPA